MGVREALLIATSAYDDPRLRALEAPGRDAEALARVLADEAIGGYAVTSVVDGSADAVRRAIGRFLARRHSEDQLLLYLSCHGIKDAWRALYFAGSDTEKDLPESTAVEAVFLNDRLKACKARRILVLLDCCFSGAFRLGGAKGDTTVHVLEGFPDTGVVVITATDELQEAWEADEVAETGRGKLSVFTGAVIRGLSSGEADRDGDGWVSAEDLYAYVWDALLTADPPQTPVRSVYSGQGTLRVARRAGAAPVPALPAAAVPVVQPDLGLVPLVRTLRETIGPAGREVLVRRSDGIPGTTGATAAVLAESVRGPFGTPQPVQDIALRLAARMTEQAGDGASSAVLVFAEFVRQLQDQMTLGHSRAALAEALPAVFDRAGLGLRRLAGEVQGEADIATVVRTAIGRPRLAGLLAQLFDQDFVIVVEQGQGPVEPELELVDGYVVDGTWLMASVPDPTDRQVFEDPAVLLFAGTVRRSDLPAPGRKPLVVVATGFLPEVLAELAARGGLAVEVPGTADFLDRLSDLSALTGGHVYGFPERTDAPLAPGRARRVRTVGSSVVVVVGEGRAADITSRIERLRADIGYETDPERRARLRHRLARLTGGLAVIGINDRTGTGERNRVVEKGIRLARQAVEHGVVTGTATALATVGMDALDWWPRQDAARRAVAQALGYALQEPRRAITAGVEGRQSAARHGAEDTSRSSWHAFRHADRAGPLDPVSVPRELLAAVRDAAAEFLALA